MPDTIPSGPPASDPVNAAADAGAASLTGLMRDYGALWNITRTPHGFTAQRRPPPAPPVIFTATSMPVLRALLEHGYDTGKLAAIMRDFGGSWHIEYLDPGTSWVAVTHDHCLTRVIVAADLDTLQQQPQPRPSRPPGMIRRAPASLRDALTARMDLLPDPVSPRFQARHRESPAG